MGIRIHFRETTMKLKFPVSALPGLQCTLAPPPTQILLPFEFTPSGQSGMKLSELTPHIAVVADELCLVQSRYSDHNSRPERAGDDPDRPDFSGKDASRPPARPSNVGQTAHWVSVCLGKRRSQELIGLTTRGANVDSYLEKRCAVCRRPSGCRAILAYLRRTTTGPWKGLKAAKTSSIGALSS